MYIMQSSMTTSSHFISNISTSFPLKSTMILLLLTTLPTILIIFTYFLHKTNTKNTLKSPVPPGPPGLPIIGNLYQFATANKLHIHLWQLSKKYGPLMHMKLGPIPVIIVSSPKLAKQVLKTHDLAICSRSRFLGQQKLSYNGVDMAFSPYGSYWRELRKITTLHLFSLKKLQSFRPIREDEVVRMVKKISSFANEVVNLSEIAMAITGTLIFRIAFSKGYDEGGSERRKLDELLYEVQALMATFFVSDYFPSFGWIDKVMGLINRLNKSFKELDLLYQELIDEHIDPNRVKKMEENDDILDILIQLKEDKSCSIDFNWDIIKALLMDIIIGAIHTSTTTIVWTMTTLMQAPHVMKEAQAEIRNLAGRKGKVDDDDLQKLPYLKAVINETLRMYPPVPMLVPRETMEKCILEGYEIQPKTVVSVNAWAVARDPKYWKSPDEFLPERFLNNNIDIKGRDYGVIPFGSGRRICPGMLMGLANVELTIANLLCSFDWELPPGIQTEDIDTDVLPGLTMHKKNPVFIVPRNYVV